MRERTRAPAKVNLRLRVHERQPSGYHRVETLFCALELSDEITIDVAEGGNVLLEVDGPDLGPAEENLAVRAARGFLERAGVAREVAIRLRKRVPVGGGLGGGSSDAAAVLRTLDRLFPGAVHGAMLRDLAAALGSDVPFFLAGDLLAAGSGRGDILTSLPPLPSMPILLALPPFPVATGAAYRWLDEDRAGGDRTAVSGDGEGASAPGSWAEAARQAVNDFEAPVFRRYPELRVIRDSLREAGASLALLSGTGSTVFGVFADEDALGSAMALLRARAPTVRLEITRTATR
ncbi:MAG: 4-(cytidine 5'-diphospho)-2-C-methyl-D-erythritol kinase [Gemmatimonadetes bacterium]|nr:4-(cytidine 5'-diphospho)-2-C-methyl-D-erythritol kinase [Gemmatimonadota bacterium]